MRHLLFIAALFCLNLTECCAQFLPDFYEIGGIHRDHRWLIGKKPEHCFGLVQWSYWTDASGKKINDYSERKTRSMRRHSYTEIWLGTHVFRVPFPAYGVAAIGVIALATLIWFMRISFDNRPKPPRLPEGASVLPAASIPASTDPSPH